jgi:hypothetical protein
MPRKRKTLILTEPEHDRSRSIKLRLDARTVITVGNVQALEFWKKRYPMAAVIH